MRNLRFTAIALLAVAVLSWGIVSAQAAKSELEGTWDGQESRAEGRQMALPPGQVRLKFEGQRLFAVGFVDPSEKELSFKLDATKAPKQFDYWLAGKDPTLAIYEVKGDVLTIGVPRDFNNKRPKAISSEKGSNVVVLVLKKRQS